MGSGGWCVRAPLIENGAGWRKDFPRGGAILGAKVQGLGGLPMVVGEDSSPNRAGAGETSWGAAWRVGWVLATGLQPLGVVAILGILNI